MLDTLIVIVLLLESLITPTKVEPTKGNLYQWRDAINPAFVALGYDEIEDIQITWETFPAHIRGATGIPVWQYNPYCGHFIGIGVTYRYTHKPWYGTPEVIWVLAHEQAHVYQGTECLSWHADRKANTAALAVLFDTEGEVYKQAGLWLLRELAIVKAVDESCKTGVDYHEWLDKLPEETLDLYGNIKCWQARNYRPYTAALDEILQSNGDVYGVDVTDIKAILGQ